MATREERIQQEKQILEEQYSGYLKKLTVDLLLKKPDDVVTFIYEWALKNGAKTDQAGQEQQAEAEAYVPPELSSSEDEDEEEDEVDMDAFLEMQKQKAAKPKARSSVSAEVYGRFNVKQPYTPKVVPKSIETKQKLREKLNQSFMFKMLEDSEKEIVLNAMEERKFSAGDKAITEGEDGDVLFLVISGNLDCTKVIDGEEKKLLTYEPGTAFGELALLYNTPRAATITANEDCVLFSLDRECFNNIVKESSIKRRERFENFIKDLELLQDLDVYERNKLCDVLQSETFKEGDYVIKEGEVGDIFYFIEEGQAIATKTDNDGNVQTVLEYKPGDYFGELSLLKDQPRAANVIAQGDLKVVHIDRGSFKRLLGPLEELLKRNAEKYKKFVDM